MSHPSFFLASPPSFPKPPSVLPPPLTIQNLASEPNFSFSWFIFFFLNYDVAATWMWLCPNSFLMLEATFLYFLSKSYSPLCSFIQNWTEVEFSAFQPSAETLQLVHRSHVLGISVLWRGESQNSSASHRVLSNYVPVDYSLSLQGAQTSTEEKAPLSSPKHMYRANI